MVKKTPKNTSKPWDFEKICKDGNCDQLSSCYRCFTGHWHQWAAHTLRGGNPKEFQAILRDGYSSMHPSLAKSLSALFEGENEHWEIIIKQKNRKKGQYENQRDRKQRLVYRDPLIARMVADAGGLKRGHLKKACHTVGVAMDLSEATVDTIFKKKKAAAKSFITRRLWLKETGSKKEEPTPKGWKPERPITNEDIHDHLRLNSAWDGANPLESLAFIKEYFA